MAKYEKNKDKLFENNWLVSILFMVKKASYRILIYFSRIFYEVQKDNIKEIAYY